jgi:hypothetical protein
MRDQNGQVARFIVLRSDLHRAVVSRGPRRLLLLAHFVALLLYLLEGPAHALQHEGGVRRRARQIFQRSGCLEAHLRCVLWNELSLSMKPLGKSSHLGDLRWARRGLLVGSRTRMSDRESRPFT